MKKIIKDIIIENQVVQERKLLHRDFGIPLDSNLIISIIGARRSGKTWLLFDIINQLLHSGLDSSKIVFINFEDERLNLKTEDLNTILESYQELFPDNDLSEVYFFFDEIQNVDSWEKFVRRIYDTKSQHIFITGSNSKLLSSEIATELRGRTISFKVFPFSFKEFLAFGDNERLNIHTQAGRSKLINLSKEFLTSGGFPDILKVDNNIQTRLLQEYFNVMIYRDIIERYKIKNTQVLKFFIKKMFASVTGSFSINKIYNELKSMGYKTSNNYLYDFLNWSNAVFLVQIVNRFHFSEIKQEKSDKKIYIIDNGLISAIDFNISKNFGKLLENQVAMEFIKRGGKIFYFRGKNECDFIVENNSEFSAVQVSWSIKDSDTKTRELKGLLEACKALKTNNGLIITIDEEDEFEYKGLNVSVVPFYKIFSKGED